MPRDVHRHGDSPHPARIEPVADRWVPSPPASQWNNSFEILWVLNLVSHILDSYICGIIMWFQKWHHHGCLGFRCDNFQAQSPAAVLIKTQDHQALPDLGAGVLWEVDLLSRHLGNLWKSIWRSIWKSMEIYGNLYGNLRFTTQLWTPAIDGLDLFQKWLGSMTTSCILKSRFTESIATTNPTWQRASFQCHAWLPEGNHIQELGVYLTIPFVEEEEAPWSSMI